MSSRAEGAQVSKRDFVEGSKLVLSSVDFVSSEDHHLPQGRFNRPQLKDLGMLCFHERHPL